MKRGFGAFLFVFILSFVVFSPNSFGASLEDRRVKDIEKGSNHQVVLFEDGTVWTWGENRFGQLGNGTTTDSQVPIQIEELSNIKEISVSDDHALALKEDGTVWRWGSEPVQITELSDVIAISAGGSNFALKQDGTVWGWGQNVRGELGRDDYKASSTPQPVQGLTDVKQIVTSSATLFALKEDGTIWGVGSSTFGQLGATSKNFQREVLQVEGAEDVKHMDAGGFTLMYVKTDGTVWGLGQSDRGQFGATVSYSETPYQVEGISDVRKISVGGTHVLAQKNDGTLWTWGENYAGQLGNESWEDSETPVPVKDLGPISDFSAQVANSFVITEDGPAWIWGDDLGYFGINPLLRGDKPFLIPWSSIGVVEKEEEGDTEVTPVQPEISTDHEPLTIALEKSPLVNQTPNYNGFDNNGDNNAQQVGIEQFQHVHSYERGIFQDIKGQEWYAQAVVTSYELGLMNGKENNMFDPEGNILLSEAITMAARVNEIYFGGDRHIPEIGQHWYSGAVQYAIEHDLIESGEFNDFSKVATRAEVAYLFSNALPTSQLEAINVRKQIPDVDRTTPYGEHIYSLYDAGVTIGVNEKGDYLPNDNISRAEAAAMLNRIALPVRRIMISPLDEDESSNGNGAIVLNLNLDGNTDLSDRWVDFELKVTSENGDEATFQMDNNMPHELYAGFQDGTYLVEAVSSDYANVEVSKNVVHMVDGKANVDITVTPRYTLEISRNGDPYSFSIINVNTNVYNGNTSHSFSVAPGESYMIQDENNQFYNAVIN